MRRVCIICFLLILATPAFAKQKVLEEFFPLSADPCRDLQIAYLKEYCRLVAKLDRGSKRGFEDVNTWVISKSKTYPEFQKCLAANQDFATVRAQQTDAAITFCAGENMDKFREWNKAHPVPQCVNQESPEDSPCPFDVDEFMGQRMTEFLIFRSNLLLDCWGIGG